MTDDQSATEPLRAARSATGIVRFSCGHQTRSEGARVCAQPVCGGIRVYTQDELAALKATTSKRRATKK